MDRRALTGWALVGWTTLLVVGAVIPPSAAPVPALSDTVLHATGYGVQAALTAMWLLSRGRAMPAALLGGLLGATVLGIGTEALQLTLAARRSELSDVVANCVGAAVGVGMVGLGAVVRSRLGGAQRGG